MQGFRGGCTEEKEGEMGEKWHKKNSFFKDPSFKKKSLQDTKWMSSVSEIHIANLSHLQVF